MIIVGTGTHVPGRVLTNDVLAAVAPTDAAWVETRLGICERHVVTSERTSDLACQAAQQALCDADLRADQLDLIIVATQTPDYVAPSTASVLQNRLGAWRAVAFDLSAVCSGFLFGLAVAAKLCHEYHHVLLVGADTFSRITDWAHRDCVYFGDGAGAVVLTRAQCGHRVVDTHLYGDGHGVGDFMVPPETGVFAMNAGAVYRQAVRHLPEAISDMVQRHNLNLDDIDWLIPHQASLHVLQAVARELNYPFERVITNMQHYGTTCAATIPMALDAARRAAKLQKGDLILLASVGAGWTWGVALVEW